MKKRTTALVSGRTMFPHGIVAEFWQPKRVTGRVVVLCDGVPAMPVKHRVAEFFARKGYWVFHIRYRGTWESEGEFLRASPADDVEIVIDAIPRGFQDTWTGVTYYPAVSDVLVVGASFAGPAVIRATRHPLVRRVVALAPVIDWKKTAKVQSLEAFLAEIKNGFPGAYRFPNKNLQKLLKKGFYSPTDWVKMVVGEKMLLIHMRDDQTVPYMPTREFARRVKATYFERARGGHVGSGALMDPAIWKKVSKFLG